MQDRDGRRSFMINGRRRREEEKKWWCWWRHDLLFWGLGIRIGFCTSRTTSIPHQHSSTLHNTSSRTAESEDGLFLFSLFFLLLIPYVNYVPYLTIPNSACWCSSSLLFEMFLNLPTTTTHHHHHYPTGTIPYYHTLLLKLRYRMVP